MNNTLLIQPQHQCYRLNLHSDPKKKDERVFVCNECGLEYKATLINDRSVAVRNERIDKFLEMYQKNDVVEECSEENEGRVVSGCYYDMVQHLSKDNDLMDNVIDSCIASRLISSVFRENLGSNSSPQIKAQSIVQSISTFVRFTPGGFKSVIRCLNSIQAFDLCLMLIDKI